MTLPRRRKRKPMGVRTPDRVRSPGHLAWVRGHECAVRSGSCAGKIQAAHVRVDGKGGISLKPGDDRTIPLCAHHHHYQGWIGEPAFEKEFGIDMAKIAASLWQADIRHRRAWEEKMEKEGAGH